MAPKRKAPASNSKPAPKPRLTKLAKQNSITNEQEQEISAAFALFAESDVEGYESEKTHGVIESGNAVRVLTALGIPLTKDDMAETIETLDPDGEGYITYEPFLAYTAIRMNVMVEEASEGTRAEEVRQMFSLFTKSGEERITVAHLKRVAKTIHEDVDDATLKDMVMEANGRGREGWKDGVTLEQFEAVLKRAGVVSGS